MTCRHLSRPNWKEYCVTCSLWAGQPPRCTINESEQYIEKEILNRKSRRGNKGQAAARRQREINTLVEKGKASSLVYYRPINQAVAAAGLP